MPEKTTDDDDDDDEHHHFFLCRPEEKNDCFYVRLILVINFGINRVPWYHWYHGTVKTVEPVITGAWYHTSGTTGTTVHLDSTKKSHLN